MKTNRLVFQITRRQEARKSPVINLALIPRTLTLETLFSCLPLSYETGMTVTSELEGDVPERLPRGISNPKRRGWELEAHRLI